MFIKYVAHQPAIVFSNIQQISMTLKATAVKPYQYKNSPRMIIINYFSKRTYSIKHVFMRMHALGERQEEFLL